MRSLIFLCLVGAAAATYGLDTIQSLPTSTFQCLAKNGYSFYIARVWTSSGNYDNTGMQNIKNARAAGWQYVDGYIFPCTKSTCASPEAQAQATVNHLNSNGAKFGMIWLDVEIYNWSSDHATNQNFITRMGNELTSLGINWGIYSNNYNWATIVGDWSHFSNKPLWWANYNNDPGFSKFVPFGGWSKPAIHQYAGDVAGPCGVDLDKNFY